MTNVCVLIFVLVVIVGGVLFLISVLFVESDSNEMSETAFECGFEPFFLPRVPFSVHFFSVTVVFLIFDLEVVILMPVLFKLSDFLAILAMSVMLWLLLVGLMVEWYDSSVAWQF